MRIGLDIDDTICYTNKVLMKYADIYNKEHGNRKLLKLRHDQKIDNVAALMDAYVAYKSNKEDFE